MHSGTVLVAVVLISGYLYIINTQQERYQFRRAAGWHCYFHVASWGVVFACIAWLFLTLSGWLGLPAFLHSFKNNLADHSPMHSSNIAAHDEINFLIFCFAALILPLLWCKTGRPILYKILDTISRRNYSVLPAGAWKAKRQAQALLKIVHDNPLEYLLAVACTENKQVIFSLKSRKFYIGLITGMPEFVNGKIEYLNFVPFISGYRDKDTLRTNMTTDYTAVFPDNDALIANEKIISCESIEDISFFDFDIYEQFKTQKDS